MSTQSEKRLAQLSQNVENMKQQQQLLQKKLQEESEKKRKLETEIQRDQQRIKVRHTCEVTGEISNYVLNI